MRPFVVFQQKEDPQLNPGFPPPLPKDGMLMLDQQSMEKSTLQPDLSRMLLLHPDLSGMLLLHPDLTGTLLLHPSGKTRMQPSRVPPLHVLPVNSRIDCPLHRVWVSFLVGQKQNKGYALGWWLGWWIGWWWH